MLTCFCEQGKGTYGPGGGGCQRTYGAGQGDTGELPAARILEPGQAGQRRRAGPHAPAARVVARRAGRRCTRRARRRHAAGLPSAHAHRCTQTLGHLVDHGDGERAAGVPLLVATGAAPGPSNGPRVLLGFFARLQRESTPGWTKTRR